MTATTSLPYVKSGCGGIYRSSIFGGSNFTMLHAYNTLSIAAGRCTGLVAALHGFGELYDGRESFQGSG
jgi:hypothetical protein